MAIDREDRLGSKVSRSLVGKPGPRADLEHTGKTMDHLHNWISRLLPTNPIAEKIMHPVHAAVKVKSEGNCSEAQVTAALRHTK